MTRALVSYVRDSAIIFMYIYVLQCGSLYLVESLEKSKRQQVKKDT